MTKAKQIASLFAIITCLVMLYSCNTNDASANAASTHSGILAETFKTDNGWGYRVFVNDKLFIRQSVIPVVPGNHYFKTETDAVKIATLVVDKIKHHQQPTIKMEELEKSGILKGID